jgi:hypothetical protein
VTNSLRDYAEHQQNCDDVSNRSLTSTRGKSFLHITPPHAPDLDLLELRQNLALMPRSLRKQDAPLLQGLGESHVTYLESISFIDLAAKTSQQTFESMQ